MDDQNVAIRLKVFIEAEGLTNSQFADICGIPRPTLSQLLSGRNKKISDLLVGQIHRAFPQLSVLWLLFDEGDMIVPVSNSDPDVPIFADSGELADWSDSDSSSVGASQLQKAGNTVENAGDKRISPTNDKDKNNFANLNALTGGANLPQFADVKVDELQKEIADLQSQIEKLKRNPRKVSQITVYYDDSTFETFVPSSRK